MKQLINRFSDRHWKEDKYFNANDSVRDHFKIAVDYDHEPVRNELINYIKGLYPGGAGFKILPQPLTFRMITAKQYYKYEDFDIHKPEHFDIIFMRDFEWYCQKNSIEKPEDFRDIFIRSEADKWTERLKMITDPKQQIVVERYLKFLEKPIIKTEPYKSLRRVYAFILVETVRRGNKFIADCSKKEFEAHVSKKFNDISPNTLYVTVRSSYKGERNFINYFDEMAAEYAQDYDHALKLYNTYYPDF